MTRIRAFSNGTEFMMWRDLNCDRCAKDCPFDQNSGKYGEAKCDIEYATAYASVDDGHIDKALADRARLPFRDGNIIEKCPEFQDADEV